MVQKAQHLPWMVAAGVVFALSFILLVAGLILPSLALVYLSIFASVAWLPLLIVGVVHLVSQQRGGAC